MRSGLPPLKSLEAFAVVGRTQSVAKAAKLLHLTPSAVSHRIRALEEHVGAPLFDRSNLGLTLTEAGIHYFYEIDSVFKRIDEATTRLREGGLANTLVVNVVHALAANWIFPRLSEFCDRHPDLTLSFQPKTSLEYSTTAPNDLRGRVEIRYGLGDWPGFHCEEILRCKSMPVCSPALARKLKSPADLADHPMIHVSLNREAWPEWLDAAGYPELRAAHNLVFDDTELKRHAALNGLGVALVLDALVANDLASGALVAPFDVEFESEKRYYLLCRPDDREDERIVIFRDWLFEIARRPLATDAEFHSSPVKILR
jgi:LysR family glycine cleavage system transcriptional activator